MLSLTEAHGLIGTAIKNKEMLLVIGNCYVEYWGRAASKLPKGKRLLMVKGDNSFAIHQNRLLRPTNYMMNARISCEETDGALLLTAKKTNPREEIKVFFYRVDAIHSHEMQQSNDLRLFGSERELSNQLMNDLSFIEEGLKPLKQESPFRKGVVDILAEDKNGDLVVVEVKRRQADFAAVTQLQRYMKQVEKIKGKKTRGILVAPEIRRNALELLENYGLEFAHFDFEIGNPKATIKGVQKKQPMITEYI
ncbi:MAG: endonuclease NucS [Candidatus Diapherotrites archaeon]